MFTAEKLCRQQSLDRVVLSGGCFQNRLLVEGCCEWPERGDKIKKSNFGRRLPLKIFTHRQVPTNDGGLALGQALIAARQSQQKW